MSSIVQSPSGEGFADVGVVVCSLKVKVLFEGVGLRYVFFSGAGCGRRSEAEAL